MVCLPTRPQRGCTVGSSLSVALHFSTPRGPNISLELGVARVVPLLGLLLGVEVVEVAEELVEAVDRRQELVLVAEVVLAELAGRVAVRLEQLGDRRVLLLEADRRRRARRPCSGPVRNVHWPVMNDDRPAVQLCSA